MRRSLIALSLIAAVCLAWSAPAAATGPWRWNHLGNGGTVGTASLNGSVTALHRSGTNLYVGGIFANAGGDPNADRIAKWNGTAWSSLGTPPFDSGAVYAIATHGGKVYAGGNFQDAESNADNLAVFDGVSWAPFCAAPGHVGPTVALQVMALQVIGTTLYVGGGFQDASGIPAADYLLACDLTTGTPSATVNGGGDFTGAVYTLTADTNGVLYAGGTFINLDGIAAADYVASYDGVWHALGAGLTTFVRAITAKGTDVYVSSDALDIGGLPLADHVAKWDGLGWSAMGSNTAGTNGWFPASTYIYGMTTHGSLVFAIGSFQNANGDPTADFIAYFDGIEWQPLGSNGAGNGALPAEGGALAVVNGQLYAGGSFTSAGGNTMAVFAASRSVRLPHGEFWRMPRP